jgi:hypothetical protein
VADFCRARQQISHRSTTVPQIALLLSSETYWDRSDAVFGNSTAYLTEVEGALDALLELQYSVDVLAEHQLGPRLAEFPLVVLPETYKLSAEFQQALLAYVNDGGNLLLLGPACARLFAADLGVFMEGEPEQTAAVLTTPAGSATVNGIWQQVVPTRAVVTGPRFPTRDTRTGGEAAATVVSHGRGQIGAIYGPLASSYYLVHHPAMRCFIGETVRRLFPDPAVSLEAPPCVDIALRRSPDGRLCLHLLNLSGVQRAERFLSTERIAPVEAVRVDLKLAEKPESVSWMPAGGELEWSWSEETLTALIPRLEIHGVLVVGA